MRVGVARYSAVALLVVACARGTDAGTGPYAREVAEAGIAAGCEFDRNSAAPADVFTLKMKDAK